MSSLQCSPQHSRGCDASQELCPPRYRQLNKNLNGGSFRDDLFLCIRHDHSSLADLRFKPELLDRFPRFDLQVSVAFLEIELKPVCFPTACEA